MVRGTFSPARAWRPAVVTRLARTLGIAARTFSRANTVKTSVSVKSIVSPRIHQFARRLQNPSESYAQDPISVRSYPSTGWRQWASLIGIEPAIFWMSPEMTLAQVIAEWRNLRSSFGQSYTAQQLKAGKEVALVNTIIGLVEVRVWGVSPSDRYPQFRCFEDWISWRLPLDFPTYTFHPEREGWTSKFFQAALQDAELSLRR